MGETTGKSVIRQQGWACGIPSDLSNILSVYDTGRLCPIARDRDRPMLIANDVHRPGASILNIARL